MNLTERIQALKEGKILMVSPERVLPVYYRTKFGTDDEYSFSPNFENATKGFRIASYIFDESLPCQIVEDGK